MIQVSGFRVPVLLRAVFAAGNYCFGNAYEKQSNKLFMS